MRVVDLIPQKYKDDLASLIKGYEGTSGWNPILKRFYPVHEPADAANLLTIGIGHLLTDNDKKTNRFKNGLTLTEVNNLFAEDLSSRAEHVYHNIMQVKDPAKCNWQLFVGILSSYFNCPSAWQPTSSPLKYFKESNLIMACTFLMQYINSNRMPQYGLLRRRATECLYILAGLILFGNKDLKQEQQLYNELRKFIKFSFKGIVVREGIK